MQQMPSSHCQDEGIQLLINGGATGIRTLAGLTTSNDLANRPLEPLEYRSVINRWRREWDLNPRTSFKVAGFQDQFLKPLGHPSASVDTFIIVSEIFQLVNNVLLFFQVIDNLHN